MPRYSDLIAEIPTGTFYSSQGSVVSNLDHPYPMRIDTKTPSDTFGVFVNNVFQFEIITDTDGIAIFNTTLPKGENVITLVNKMTQQPIKTYLTVRDWATWLTAYADQLTQFDTAIDPIKSNSRNLAVNYEMADPVWGQRLLTDDSPAYPITTYRDVLQQVQQGYRRFGGITGGLNDVVAAFTQVNPWMCPTTFGPEWVLGNDFVNNRYLQGYPNGLATNPWPDIDPTHSGNVTISYSQSFCPIYSPNPLFLSWDSAARRFTYLDTTTTPYTYGNGFNAAQSGYVAPTGTFSETLEAHFQLLDSSLAPWLSSTTYTMDAYVTYNGRYYRSLINNNIDNIPDLIPSSAWVLDTAYTPWTPLNVVHGLIGPYDTSINNYIGLDLGQGPITIALTSGPTTTSATIANDINAALAADPRYAAYGGVTIFYEISGAYIAFVGPCPLIIVPPMDTSGNVLPDAAPIIWGRPWIWSTVGATLSVTPPATATLSLVSVANFQIPQYPSAYSVNVVFTIGARNILLSLPVLSIDSGTNTMVLDTSGYSWLATGNINVGSLVYPSVQTNYAVRGSPITSKITINVSDTSLLPIVPISPYQTVVNNNFLVMPNALASDGVTSVAQTGIAPNDWYSSASADINVLLNITDGWLQPSALVVSSLADQASWTLTTQIKPSLKDWEGFIGEYGVWVGREADATGNDVEIDVTLNFMSNSLVSPISTYTNAYNVAADQYLPVQINGNIIVPPASDWDYATLSVSLVWPGSGSLTGTSIRIDEAYLKIWTHTGVNLGFNTIPRNAKRADRGYMLYTWCPDPLLPAEETLLGLPQYNIDPPYVTSLDNLRAITITPTFGDQTYAVVNTGTIYQYNTSIGANTVDNGNTIIKPNNVAVASNGRWYLVVYPTGHISTVSPTQVTVDRFDISDGQNLVGVFTDNDFDALGAYSGSDYNSAIGLCNLDVVPAAPVRFSYLAPHKTSTVTATAYPVVNPTPTPGLASDWTIQLPDIWDENLNTLTLYEDRNDGNGPISIPHGFAPYPSGQYGISSLGLISGASFIGVNGLTTFGSTYTIEYQRLTQVTTNVMQLPTTYLNYQWWADWVTFRILDMVPQDFPTYTGLQFDGNYTATLNIRSNLDQSQSLLVRHSSDADTNLLSTQWSYINSNTIRISPQVFDAQSTYTLQYTGRVIDPMPIPQVTVEIRQGKTAADVLLAQWQILPHYNTLVKTVLDQFDPLPTNVFPYFQMRMSISNIPDTRFLRVCSMMLKGIPVNLWGNKTIIAPTH